MSIDKETVGKIAKLARIAVTEEQQENLAGELGQIMAWIEQLGEVDTEGVEPLTSVVDMALYQRPDEINDGDMRDKVLANAPETAEGFYVVPKVVE